MGALEASRTWRPDRWPPGRCPFRDPWWVRESGVHSGSGDSGGHGGAENLALIFPGGQGGSGSSVALALGPATQAEDIWPPQKKILGEVPLWWALWRSGLCRALGKR